MTKNNHGQIIFWIVFAVALAALAAVASGIFATRPQPQATGFFPFYPPSNVFDYTGASGDGSGFGVPVPSNGKSGGDGSSGGGGSSGGRDIKQNGDGFGGQGCPAGSSYCDSDTTKWDGNKQKCVAKGGGGKGGNGGGGNGGGGGGGGGKTCGTTNPITCSTGQVCVAVSGGIVDGYGRARIGFECSSKTIDELVDGKSCWRNLTYGIAFDNADVICAAP